MEAREVFISENRSADKSIPPALSAYQWAGSPLWPQPAGVDEQWFDLRALLRWADDGGNGVVDLSVGEVTHERRC
jgi:hypothetical protein